jgi:hypothetical protein
MREALPLNWVDRQKGGKVKARFVYMRFRPGLFDFGEIGASCDVDKLGYDGVNLFKEWAKTYGCLHPYSPGDLQRLNEPQTAAVEPTPTPEPTPVQPQPTPQAEPVAPDHGCRDDAGNVIHAWITPGKEEWWQEFEHSLIQATTLAQLQEAKTKVSALRRTTVMGKWQADGRYPWLEAKEARLETEANSFEQPTLGQTPQPEIIELPDDWETSLPEYTP